MWQENNHSITNVTGTEIREVITMKGMRYRFEVSLSSEEEHDRWKQEAQERKLTISDLIKTAVNQYLKQTK